MLVAWSGWALLHGGVFAYHNYYGRDVYSAEVVVFGVVVMVLALVPDSWVARLLE